MSELRLAEGQLLQDRKKRHHDRVVRLVKRINPQGRKIKPYWEVKNIDTGRVTLIREDRIEGPRWINAPSM